MPPWQTPHSRRTRLRRRLALATGALACYLASYAAFSAWGQYVRPPQNPDAAPVWAPGEFYDFATGRWRRSRTVIYAPLLWLDQKLWHRAPAG